MKNLSNEMYENYKNHLFVITSGLEEMAKAAGRTKFVKNQLLRECYNLLDEEVRTEDEWKEEGARVKRDERPYLFWKGEDVSFRYSRSQVIFEEVN